MLFSPIRLTAANSACPGVEPESSPSRFVNYIIQNYSAFVK
nr:MAG TPA: hypothetical protein [Herelleviridae sp.]